MVRLRVLLARYFLRKRGYDPDPYEVPFGEQVRTETVTSTATANVPAATVTVPKRKRRP